MLFAKKADETPPGESTGPIVWRTEKRRIGDLVEWERNPRQLTEKQAADLEASLKKFGYVEEIVVNADGKSIIGGHMRKRVTLARALLNPEAMVDVRIPSRPLSEDEGIELAIRLNKNTGDWNYDALANDFDIVALKEWGFLEADLGMFSVAPTEKQPAPGGQGEFQQMTFVLHASQVAAVEHALEMAKGAGMGTDSANENSNGNALAGICQQWAMRRGSS